MKHSNDDALSRNPTNKPSDDEAKIDDHIHQIFTLKHVDREEEPLAEH